MDKKVKNTIQNLSNNQNDFNKKYLWWSCCYGRKQRIGAKEVIIVGGWRNMDLVQIILIGQEKIRIIWLDKSDVGCNIKGRLRHERENFGREKDRGKDSD